MSAATGLRPEFVHYIPERLDAGVLYVSRRYNTASHLCCCGCGREVVTPLNPAKWQLTEHPDGRVSLMPSIGNWSFPCQSHYFIVRNRVSWAGAMSARQIAAVRARDRGDVERLAARPEPPKTFGAALRGAWDEIVGAIKDWFGRR